MTIWSATDPGDEGLLKIGELVMKNISKLQPTKLPSFHPCFETVIQYNECVLFYSTLANTGDLII